MFRFKYVEDARTGDRYWIDKAVLANDEGPAEDGANLYTVDLQPYDDDLPPIRGLDLVMRADGKVYITTGLSVAQTRVETDKPNYIQGFVEQAVVYGDTLLAGVEDDALRNANLSAWDPAEADRVAIAKYLWWEYINLFTDVLCDENEKFVLQRLMEKVLEKPLGEFRDAAQEHFLTLYRYYAGIAETALDDKSESGGLIRRVLGLKEA